MWPNPFAQSTVVDTKIYYPRREAGTASVNGTTSISSWQTWQKPNGCSFVYMLIIASGGGGGRPTSGATTTAGGGGGSGGHTRVMIPAMFLPETLYVWPGSGGLGATTVTTAGAQGQPCVISCEPQLSASNVAATSTTANYVLYQVGGSGGAASTTAGAAGVIGLITNQQIASSGLWFSVAGQAGSAGASATNGSGGAVPSGHNVGVITTGGSGGGNGTGSGGALTTNTGPLRQTIAGSATGVVGKPGIGLNSRIEQLISRGDPIYFSGGSGGGGISTAAVAPAGGDAGYGGGGGGGGSGTLAGSTSGNGGNGGDGLIIIMSW